MHDGEPEVFNLANRCLETSSPRPRDFETSCCSFLRTGSKDQWGGDDSWKEIARKIDTIRSRASMSRVAVKLGQRSDTKQRSPGNWFQLAVATDVWKTVRSRGATSCFAVLKRVETVVENYWSTKDWSKTGPDTWRIAWMAIQGWKRRGCKPPLSIFKLQLHPDSASYFLMNINIHPVSSLFTAIPPFLLPCVFCLHLPTTAPLFPSYFTSVPLPRIFTSDLPPNSPPYNCFRASSQTSR